MHTWVATRDNEGMWPILSQDISLLPQLCKHRDHLQQVPPLSCFLLIKALGRWSYP